MQTYDLSHPIRSEMPVYPGNPPVEVARTASIEADGYRTAQIRLDSHTGTHMDAPAHMRADGPTLDEFPPEAFRFSAAVVDCRPLSPRSQIMPQRVANTLSEINIDTIDMVILQTGWDTHWGTDQYFDHPFLAPETAAWLAERNLHLGIDALNIDPTPTENASENEQTGYPVHHTLFAADRLVVENLRGLAQLPAQCTLHAYPLAIEDADGSPVRAIATTDSV